MKVHTRLLVDSPQFRPKNPEADDEVELLEVGGGPGKSNRGLHFSSRYRGIHHLLRELGLLFKRHGNKSLPQALLPLLFPTQRLNQNHKVHGSINYVRTHSLYVLYIHVYMYIHTQMHFTHAFHTRVYMIINKAKTDLQFIDLKLYYRT